MLVLGKFICQNLYFRGSSSDGSTDLILRAILEELVDAFGFEKNSILSKTICALLIQLAKKFAIKLIDFDREVGKSGLLEAARKALPNYIRTLSVTGADSVPPRGPLLVLANHPGLSDALCLIAAIQRLDLRVIALERPLLRALPNTSKYLFFVDSSPAKRMTAARQVVAHLKGGGAVLIFPAGKIEPDPDVYDGAEQSLANWSDSVSLFLRLVPETQVVPALVRGVLWEKAVKHPITILRRGLAERERLGAALQLIFQLQFDARPVDVRVEFGYVIRPQGLGASHPDALHGAVLECMRQLLQRQKSTGKHAKFGASIDNQFTQIM